MMLFGAAWSGVPYFLGVLGNGAVAGELAGSVNVQYRFARPCRWIRVRPAWMLMRLGVTREVGYSSD